MNLLRSVIPLRLLPSVTWIAAATWAAVLGGLPCPGAEVSAEQTAAVSRVLLVTGEDYPGHKWKLTTPVLKGQLEKDARLSVDVLDDLTKLRPAQLAGYAAVVMHFKNYDPEVPGRAGFDALEKHVADGGGLVLVHFACGAFQEFRDEFATLAGRAWNPKLRGHDPRGEFRVEITDVDHPVTRGMKPFAIADELYTCLDGDVPITVLAEAKSKVDGKRYPMVFVLNHGKGRVFHCVLGHDTTALGNEGAGRLFRRGTAWVAGLEPAHRGRLPAAD